MNDDGVIIKLEIVTVNNKELNVECEKWEIREGFLWMYKGGVVNLLGGSQIRMIEANGESIPPVVKG